MDMTTISNFEKAQTNEETFVTKERRKGKGRKRGEKEKKEGEKRKNERKTGMKQ